MRPGISHLLRRVRREVAAVRRAPTSFRGRHPCGAHQSVSVPVGSLATPRSPSRSFPRPSDLTTSGPARLRIPATEAGRRESPHPDWPIFWLCPGNYKLGESKPLSRDWRANFCGRIPWCFSGRNRRRRLGWERTFYWKILVFFIITTTSLIVCSTCIHS